MTRSIEHDIFVDPDQPTISFFHMHDHEWTEVGAHRNPNGTWSSLWACAHCPDIGRGGYVGPVPDGWCACGWVQKKWPRKRCEECRRPMTSTPA